MSLMFSGPDVPCTQCGKIDCFVYILWRVENIEIGDDKILGKRGRKCKECGNVELFDEDINNTN